MLEKCLSDCLSRLEQLLKVAFYPQVYCKLLRQANIDDQLPRWPAAVHDTESKRLCYLIILCCSVFWCNSSHYWITFLESEAGKGVAWLLSGWGEANRVLPLLADPTSRLLGLLYRFHSCLLQLISPISPREILIYATPIFLILLPRDNALFARSWRRHILVTKRAQPIQHTCAFSLRRFSELSHYSLIDHAQLPSDAGILFITYCCLFCRQVWSEKWV